MKNIHTLVLILFSFHSLAQEPIIRFDQFAPRWYHIAKDITFMTPSVSNLDEYTAFVNWIPVLEKDYTYAHFFSRNEIGEMDGGFVQKIQNTDGSIEWSKLINTRHNYYQVCSQALLETSDSTLVMIGMKRTNQTHRPFPAWGNVYGYAVPWIIEMDKRTGNIISEKVDMVDTLGTIQIIGAKVYFFNKKGVLIQSNYDSGKIKLSRFDNSSFRFIPFQYLKFNKIVPDSSIESAILGTYSMNDSMFLIPYYIKSKANDIAYDEASLEIYKLEQDTYSLFKKINLLPYYIRRPDLSDFNENVVVTLGKNGDMVLINTYKNPDNIFQYKNSLLWLDSTGTEKLYMKEIKLPGSAHVYSFIKRIFLDNNHMYLAGFPSVNGVHGFDILKIGIDGQTEMTGSLTTSDTGNNLRSSYFYVDESGLVNMTVFWDRHFNATIGFHLSDLGINFSSGNSDFISPKPILILSPNPAIDETILRIGNEKYVTGTAYIYNLTGQKVLSQKITSGEILDTKALPTGQYIVQYAPDSRPGYFLTSKLVKN